MSGLPSSAFTLDEFTHNGTEYIFVEPTFETPGSEFIMTRWVWLITYDTRFLATTHHGQEGYALPHADVSTVTSRLQVIDSPPVAAVRTYFADHNMNPDHLTVTLDTDYASTPEGEAMVSVAYTPPAEMLEAPKEMELNAWNQAVEAGSVTQTGDDPPTVTLSVADARQLLAEYFGGVNESYWASQASDAEWGLEREA